MSELQEHSTGSRQFEFGFDRQSIRGLLARHRWLTWFLFGEVVILSIASAIPFLGSSRFHYLVFGMLLSIALLAAVIVTLVGASVAVRRLLHAARSTLMD